MLTCNEAETDKQKRRDAVAGLERSEGGQSSDRQADRATGTGEDSIDVGSLQWGGEDGDLELKLVNETDWAGSNTDGPNDPVLGATRPTNSDVAPPEPPSIEATTIPPAPAQPQSAPPTQCGPSAPPTAPTLDNPVVPHSIALSSSERPRPRPHRSSEPQPIAATDTRSSLSPSRIPASGPEEDFASTLR